MKKIEDYIHLYLGCDVLDTWNDKIGKLVDVRNMGKGVGVAHSIVWSMKAEEIKLLLRPLDSMTDQESDDFGISTCDGVYTHTSFEPDAVYGQWHSVIEIHTVSERINEMRKRGFDCDGLIESGLAIDKTSAKQLIK